MLTIRRNDNTEIVDKVSLALKINGGYCPCRIEKTDDTKCICKEFREQNKPGECYCGLYIKQ